MLRVRWLPESLTTLMVSKCKGTFFMFNPSIFYLEKYIFNTILTFLCSFLSLLHYNSVSLV